MDPVFTLHWPEFVVAEKLQRCLPRKEGYSILVPLSRQEKGIDLAILKILQSPVASVATIQVKSSRIYFPQIPKRGKTIRFKYYTWFNRFDVPSRADFIILFGMYSIHLDNPGMGAKDRYQDCSLLFTNKEMEQFFNECKTKTGKPDQMFGFGFNDLSNIFLTRGVMDKTIKDYANFLLEKRLEDLKRKLAGQQPNQINEISTLLDN